MDRSLIIRLFSQVVSIYTNIHSLRLYAYSLSLFGSLLVGYVDFHDYVYNAKAAIRPTYLRET